MSVSYLEERETHVEFEEDAANAPDITRLRPAQLQDDLRRPVVPGGHDGRVVLPVEGGRAEVDHFDVRVANHALVSSLNAQEHAQTPQAPF